MNYLKVLGASGSKTKLTGTTSFQIFKDIIVDAGNVIGTLGDDALNINHIFLTHSHSDHIIDLPFLIESFFEQRKKTLTIYGSIETISSLKAHMFNDEIWPDFTKINLLNSNKKSLVFKIIQADETIILSNYSITAIIANHIPGAFGFRILKDNNNGYIISGDTYKQENLWNIINNDKRIEFLIVECSFPSSMEKLAFDSKHYTPKILAEEIKNLTRDDLQIFIYHLKPLYYNQMTEEINDYKILSNGGKILEEGDVIQIGNVSKVARYIAQTIHDDDTVYKENKYSKNDFKQIRLATAIHDIGKISTPESIMDKGTKLEKIVDRIELIKTRFEVIKKDLEILLLKEQITKEFYIESLEQIKDDIEFLKEINKGSEFTDEKKISRIKLISEYTYSFEGRKVSLLDDDEIKNLSIVKGTLTNEEKDIMNSHVQLSLDMLKTLPFPKKYKNVLDIAANHHEKLNGKGYPRGLSEKDLTLEDRTMILADIFEALTAKDRPYKDAKKLSEVFKILSFMAKNNEIDLKLLKFFHNSEALRNYANEELNPNQIDKSKINI